MTDDMTKPNSARKVRFSTESGAEQVGDQQGQDSANAFWDFVAAQEKRGDQVFTFEDVVDGSGLRFDHDRGLIVRFKRFLDDDGYTQSHVSEQFTFVEDDERSRALVLAQLHDGFKGTYPLAAWSDGVPTRIPDYADDDPETREYVLSCDCGAAQRLRIRHPNETTYALRAFLVRHDGHDVFIEDPESGERLALMRGDSLIARTAGRAAGDSATGSSGRTEFMKVDLPNRYAPAASLFFAGGFAGLDRFGRWLTDIRELDLSAAAQGQLRAASFGSTAEVLSQVGRMWADSGAVDPSDRYWVFFDSSSLDEDETERAELLALLDRLGLKPAERPAEATDGEVWVLREARLDAELDRWF